MKTKPKCFKHRRGPNKMGYTEWHSKAAESYRKGQRQRQCPGCGLWFFPWEMQNTS